MQEEVVTDENIYTYIRTHAQTCTHTIMYICIYTKIGGWYQGAAKDVWESCHRKCATSRCSSAPRGDDTAKGWLPADVAAQVDILKSQLAAQFAIWNDNRAGFSEYVGKYI